MNLPSLWMKKFELNNLLRIRNYRHLDITKWSVFIASKLTLRNWESKKTKMFTIITGSKATDFGWFRAIDKN